VTPKMIPDLNARVMASRAKAAAARAAELPTAQAPKPTAKPASPAGDRWQTFNGFVDVIAPRLTLAERAVWLVLFRHARGCVVETTARTLATAADIDKETASLALKAFEAVGLVWPIWKSTDRSRSSKYGMHHRPGECLAKVLKRRAPK